MHRIGFNLLPWSATVSEALYPHIERIRDIGYDGIEYSMGAQDAEAYRGLGAFWPTWIWRVRRVLHWSRGTIRPAPMLPSGNKAWKKFSGPLTGP